VTESKETRSRIMQAVKSRDTSGEMIVRRLLHKHGYRYRLHQPDLPGTPDLVFIGQQKAIFVHGCFWHGHHCARGARSPKTNAAYWVGKIARNIARDALNLGRLTDRGWRILVLWECELRDCASLLARLDDFLGRGDGGMTTSSYFEGSFKEVLEGLSGNEQGRALAAVLQSIEDEVGRGRLRVTSNLRRAVIDLPSGRTAAVRVTAPRSNPAGRSLLRFKRPVNLKQYERLYFGGIGVGGKTIVHKLTPAEVGDRQTISLPAS
jgi:DNA mismatch endonuclease, patch repair protein